MYPSIINEGIKSFLLPFEASCLAVLQGEQKTIEPNKENLTSRYGSNITMFSDPQFKLWDRFQSRLKLTASYQNWPLVKLLIKEDKLESPNHALSHLIKHNQMKLWKKLYMKYGRRHQVNSPEVINSCMYTILGCVWKDDLPLLKQLEKDYKIISLVTSSYSQASILSEIIEGNAVKFLQYLTSLGWKWSMADYYKSLAIGKRKTNWKNPDTFSYMVRHPDTNFQSYYDSKKGMVSIYPRYGFSVNGFSLQSVSKAKPTIARRYLEHCQKQEIPINENNLIILYQYSSSAFAGIPMDSWLSDD